MRFARIALVVSALLLTGMTGTGSGSSVVLSDNYDFIMRLRVPQVLNNTTSQGERRFKVQSIKGTFSIRWHGDGSVSYALDDAKNTSFKVGGKYVTYETLVGGEIMYPRFNYIGNNKTGKFLTPALCVSMVLEPSYALKEADSDNSFWLVLSGKGTSALKNRNRIATSISGYAVGTQGCSCGDYGHVSPTRGVGCQGPTSVPEDAVATYGTWSMRWKSRTQHDME